MYSLQVKCMPYFRSGRFQAWKSAKVSRYGSYCVLYVTYISIVRLSSTRWQQPFRRRDTGLFMNELLTNTRLWSLLTGFWLFIFFSHSEQNKDQPYCFVAKTIGVSYTLSCLSEITRIKSPSSSWFLCS